MHHVQAVWHVTSRYTHRFKTKALSAPVPCLLAAQLIKLHGYNQGRITVKTCTKCTCSHYILWGHKGLCLSKTPVYIKTEENGKDQFGKICEKQLPTLAALRWHKFADKQDLTRWVIRGKLYKVIGNVLLVASAQPVNICCSITFAKLEDVQNGWLLPFVFI